VSLVIRRQRAHLLTASARRYYVTFHYGRRIREGRFCFRGLSCLGRVYARCDIHMHDACAQQTFSHYCCYHCYCITATRPRVFIDTTYGSTWASVRFDKILTIKRRRLRLVQPSQMTSNLWREKKIDFDCQLFAFGVSLHVYTHRTRRLRSVPGAAGARGQGKGRRKST